MSQKEHKWFNLFEKEIKNLESLEFLHEINIGYNSKVYIISINGNQYAVKIYDKRFNGTNVCQIERNNIINARELIPYAVPEVIFYSKHVENGFDREILVMENVKGVLLNKNIFNEQVFVEMINILKRLHRTKTKSRRTIFEIGRLKNCRKTIMQFLNKKEIISIDRSHKHLDDLRRYYYDKKIFEFQKTIIHGDLWWDNILVDSGKIKIIDWLEASVNDYCRDLAQLKIGILNELLDKNQSKYFFKKILNEYREEFKDDTIYDRIRYYLPLMYLEEAFYLPFRFFPWEIKYRENAEEFEERFIKYFEKSELFFQCGFLIDE
jgi:thiamine kinase-like enzyme